MTTLLSELAGLPVGFDPENGEFSYDPAEVACESSKRVPLIDIIPGLLNKSLRYPETVYEHLYRMRRTSDHEVWPDKMSYDIICIPSGLLGIEYNKTHIFFAELQEGKASCLVQVFQGTLTVILQRNAINDDPYSFDVKVQDARILRVKKGEKAVIPSGYFYTFINAGEEAVIFARVVVTESPLAYERLRRVNGMAYYLIAKNARQEIVSNPRYREIVKVKRTSIQELNTFVGYQPAVDPLYVEVKSRTQTLADFL